MKKAVTTAVAISIATAILFSVPALVKAQTLELQSSNPADGSTGVGQVTNISFTFNKALDTETMLEEYEDIFVMEPFELVLITEDPVFSNNDRTITLSVVHMEEGDYIWFVFGALAADGSYLAAPYLLRYTTLAQLGPYQVSGTVTHEDVPLSGINQLGRDAVYSSAGIRNLATPGRAEREKLIGQVRTWMAESSGPDGKHLKSIDAITENGQIAIVAMLFDRNPFVFDDEDDELEPAIKAAAIVGSNGSYTIPYVRNGEYYPVAIEFSGDGFESAFGFYDPEGTGMPASITVAGSSLSGIDMVLGTFAPMTASEALEILTTTHSELIEGQDLISMVTVLNLFGTDQEINGASIFWTFIYHNRTEDIAMGYIIYPFGIVEADDDVEGWFFDMAGDGENLPDEIDYSRMGAIESFADSDIVTAVIEQKGGSAFREEHGELPFFYITLSAGNFYWTDLDDDLASDRFLWKMDYVAFDFTGFFATATYYADMHTGDFITGTFTLLGDNAEMPARVELNQNYPNPFNPATVIPFRLDSDSHVRLSVYNMLGQEIATIAEGSLPAGEHLATWNAGNLSSGIYLYRLVADGKTLTRKMVLVK